MAVDIKDVEQVAQELQQKFDDFKAKNDKRVDAIEQEKGKLAGQVETLNGKLSELENLKSDLEKELLELKRPTGGAQNKLATEHKEAFVGFLRKGREDGLRDLERKALQVPVPWPSATPPTGWLKCNGAAFSAEEYPELAKAYPTNKLPDLRGEFIRGWDDGRGIDAVRALLSLQNGGVESHTHQGQLFRVSDYRTKEIPASEVMGRGYIASLKPGADSPLDFDDYSVSSNPNGYFVGNQRTTAYGINETRPRNIAFNYIVRAA